MESSQAAVNDSSNSGTPNKASVELNERKSSSNSNGDSGYHSDIGGYKGEDSVDNEYELILTENSEFTDEQHVDDHSLQYSSQTNTSSRNAPSSGATTNDCENNSATDNTSANCKAATQHNIYVASSNGAIKSCSSCTLSNYDSFENMHVTATTESSIPHDCSLQEASVVYTSIKTINSYHPKDDLKSIVQDLALKIEFCLMFGYTVSQVNNG